MELHRITTFINSQLKSLGCDKTKPIDVNYTITMAYQCKPSAQCPDCVSVGGPPIKCSAFDPTPLLAYAKDLATLLKQDAILSRIEKIKTMKCKLAIRYSSTVIIHELTEICTNDMLSIEDQTMLQYNYQFTSSHCNFDIVGNSLSFSTKVDITIQPSEVKMLDCILHSRCQHHPQLDMAR